MCQETQEKSHPPVHQVIGMQTSVLAGDPAVACEPAPAPLSHSVRDPGEQCLKTITLSFPGGAVVGSLPANAGDTGSSPGLGESHMLRSDWAREPQLLSLRVWSLCSATGGAGGGRDSERPVHGDEEWPPLAATGGGPRTETKTQHSQK